MKLEVFFLFIEVLIYLIKSIKLAGLKNFCFKIKIFLDLIIFL
jgi:hypothetical protein